MSPSEWANNLIHDEHFKTVFEELRQVQINKIVNSQEDDLRAREAAYIKLNAIQEVLTHIHSLADNQKIKSNKWKIF